MWGDYFGAWAWHAGTPTGPATPTGQRKEGRPSAHVRVELVIQSVVGLLPTLLAVAGFLAFARSSLRSPARLGVALVPVLGVLAYLYFAVAYRYAALNGRRPAQGDLPADDDGRLGARLRLRPRPAPRPGLAADGRPARARRARRAAVPVLLATSPRSTPPSYRRGFLGEVASMSSRKTSSPGAAASRARRRSGTDRRRSPSGRTGG